MKRLKKRFSSHHKLYDSGCSNLLSNLSATIPLHLTHTRLLARHFAGVLFFWLLLCVTIPGHGTETKQMRGPKNGLVKTDRALPADAPPSHLRSVLLGSVRFFQEWISPIDGPRCSFSPTCSHYGYEAINDHGPLLGIVMTADRLMRCSYWTEAGPDYKRLPIGTLHDPVANNLLMQP